MAVSLWLLFCIVGSDSVLVVGTVRVDILFAPLGAPVLEPDLHLAFVHAQRVGEARSLRSGQVLGLLEHLFECVDLLASERRSRALTHRFVRH